MIRLQKHHFSTATLAGRAMAGASAPAKTWQHALRRAVRLLGAWAWWHSTLAENASSVCLSGGRSDPLPLEATPSNFHGTCIVCTVQCIADPQGYYQSICPVGTTCALFLIIMRDIDLWKRACRRCSGCRRGGRWSLALSCERAAALYVYMNRFTMTRVSLLTC